MADTSKTQDVARYALGAALMTAGIVHLTVGRKEFRAQVPPWMPLDTDQVVIGSGIGEISLGAAVAFAPEKVRPIVGCAAAGFFAAIFPGNIAQYQESRNAFGLDTDAKRFGRLFMQPVLCAWALWASGATNRK